MHVRRLPDPELREGDQIRALYLKPPHTKQSLTYYTAPSTHSMLKYYQNGCWNLSGVALAAHGSCTDASATAKLDANAVAAPAIPRQDAFDAKDVL